MKAALSLAVGLLAIGCDASSPAPAPAKGTAAQPTPPDDGKQAAVPEALLTVEREGEDGPFLVKAGALGVRVFVHEMHPPGDDGEAFGVWTMVTDGLAAGAGAEVVLVVKRAADAADDAFPRGPIQLLGALAGDAKLLRSIEPGATIDASEGVVGRDDLRGMLFIDPEATLPEGPAEVPPGSLLAVLLTTDELALVRSHGPYRVLDRLGDTAGVFPFPCWYEPGRAAVADPSMAAGSMLSRMPRMRWLQMTTRLRGGELLVRASKGSAEARRGDIEGLLAADAFAFLTGPDRAAPARAFWTPGSKEPEAIGGPAAEGGGVDLTGCFLIAAADDRSGLDRSVYVEDGFALTLTRATMASFKKALRGREDLTLDLAEGGAFGRFRLVWAP